MGRRHAHPGERGRHAVHPQGWLGAGSGLCPAKFTYVFEATTNLPEIYAFRPELFTDPNLPAYGPGRSYKGTCTLTEFEVEASGAREPEKKRPVKLVKATADFANEDRDLEPNFDDKSGRKRVTGRVEFAIDGKRDTAWGIDAGPGRRNTDRGGLRRRERSPPAPCSRSTSEPTRWLEQQRPPANLGRFRLSVTAARAAPTRFPGG